MSIESVSHENRIFNPSQTFQQNAAVSSMDAYHALCTEAKTITKDFGRN